MRQKKPLFVYVVGESPVRLWGLSASERISRVLGHTHEVTLLSAPSEVEGGTRVLLVRGDRLFDNRVLEGLAEAGDVILTAGAENGREAVAASVPASRVAAVAESLQSPATEGWAESGLEVLRFEEITSAFEQRLRKSDPPFVLPVTADNADRLQTLLFDAAYKGITDFVTKWVWPRPALLGVRVCVKFGVRPNHVTALSWVLAVFAGLLFWAGHPGPGLACGWLMTFLDTVDGKLARVTVTSSPFGHLFDHVLDLVHPPFWYLAWGVGLASYQPAILPPDLAVAMWVIFPGYIVGRLLEGSFQLLFGMFGIFSWRRIDSYSRLITARRNPCLVLLTLGLLAGRPDLGLEAVAIWTLVSTAFLLVRWCMAGYARLTGSPLGSWLAEAADDPTDGSLAVRWFAGNPAGTGTRAGNPGAGTT
jgi:phosphatidylglycerophosphate synthase